MAPKQNYFSRLDTKKQQQIASGTVSSRFPEVSGMVIRMTYFSNGHNPVLMYRTVNVFPTGYAYFNMDCMIKGCSEGGFDLTPVITEMVKKHQKLRKGNLVCSGKNTDLAADHATIDYEVAIMFHRKPQKQAS